MTDASLHTFWEDVRDNFPTSRAAIPSLQQLVLFGIWEAVSGGVGGGGTGLTQAEVQAAIDGSTDIDTIITRLTEIRDEARLQREFSEVFVLDAGTGNIFERRTEYNESDGTSSVTFYTLDDAVNPAAPQPTGGFSPAFGTSTGNTISLTDYEGNGTNALYPDGQLFTLIQVIDSDGNPVGVGAWRAFDGTAVAAPLQTEVDRVGSNVDEILETALTYIGNFDAASIAIPADVTTDPANINNLLRRISQQLDNTDTDFVTDNGTISAVGDVLEQDASALGGVTSHSLLVVSTGIGAGEEIAIDFESRATATGTYGEIGITSSFVIDTNETFKVPLGSTSEPFKRVIVTSNSGTGTLDVTIHSARGGSGS